MRRPVSGSTMGYHECNHSNYFMIITGGIVMLRRLALAVAGAIGFLGCLYRL
jgi:hypothetical protein